MKNKKGFTLIELVVVIGILSVLSMMIVPLVSGYMARAKEAVINANFNTCYREYKTVETLVDAGVEKNFDPTLEKALILNSLADRYDIYRYCFLDYDANNNWWLVYHHEELKDVADRSAMYDFN